MAAGAFAYGVFSYVPAPEVVETGKGLLVTADVRTVDDGDPALRGFQFDSDSSEATVGVVSFTGSINTTTALTDNADESNLYKSDDPFTIYGSYSGVMPVRSPEEANERAALRLAAGEGIGVEKAFWNGTLAKHAAGNILNNGTAVSAKLGLGLLAEYMGLHYIGVPYVHAGFRAVNELAGGQLVSLPQDGPPATQGGAMLVPGAGYSDVPTINTHADGSGTAITPTATQAWLFGSGQAVLYRGAVNPTVAPAWTINQVHAFAERTYVPGVDGQVAAVLINLT